MVELSAIVLLGMYPMPSRANKQHQPSTEILLVYNLSCLVIGHESLYYIRAQLTNIIHASSKSHRQNTRCRQIPCKYSQFILQPSELCACPTFEEIPKFDCEFVFGTDGYFPRNMRMFVIFLARLAQVRRDILLCQRIC